MRGRCYIARHGETVFNAAQRMQGDVPHTPLTRQGFAQAEEMGAALRQRLGSKPRLTLWASPAGRALQTLAVVAEHLELDWHDARTDERLREIDLGGWGGRYYRDLHAEIGSFVDPVSSLFTVSPPGGEWYDAIAVRLQSWIDEQANDGGDRLIIMHGVSSRVLRGLLTGIDHRPECRAPVAEPLPQGTVICVEKGAETIVHLGSGQYGVSRPASV